MLGWIMALALLVVLVAVLANRPSKRFGLAEFRRVAISARYAVAGLIDGGVLSPVNSDQRLVAERAVVRAQVGTVEALGHKNVVSVEAATERDERSKTRAQSRENIAAHEAAICELEDQITAEEVAIKSADSADDSLNADLALLS